MTDPWANDSKQPVHVKEIAGFELLTLLGQGGMGMVFKARQRSVDRLVALKVLTPKLSSDPDYVGRFELEAKAAAKLTHPNVVAVIDRGEDQVPGGKTIRWIAFEFVDGLSLEKRIEKGKVPEREGLAIVRAIAEALKCAHQHGLIHRDIKPDNILITKEGTPKLADLGLAKFEDDEAALTRTGIVMGTPHYMAPEQAMGDRDLDIRCDVYALGLVLYRAVTGALPWNMPSVLAVLNRHINEDCPDPRLVAPEVSEGTAELIRAMTARERDGRLRPEEVLTCIDRSMGRTASATVKTVAPNLKSSSSARRALATRSSGRARTVDPATVAVSAAPKIEKETEPPARERQVVAVAVVVGALFLAVAVGLLARKGGAADKGDPAPPVTTVDDKKPPPPPPPPPPPAPRPPVPPPPPDPRPPADPPPPVVPDDPDRLDDRRLALLVDAVKHASKLAADDPREALADLDIDKAKAAQDAVSAARDLVKAVSESTGLLQDRITKDRTKARDQLVEVLETIAKVEPTAQDKGGAIAHATRDEAVAWVSAVKAFVALHQHLRGIEDPPGDFAPDESGPGKQYGEFWSKGIVQHLLPAVRLAEKSDWKNALHEADLAHTALRAGFSDDKHVLLEPAYESASAIARLAGEADSRNLTAIAAWESVYDARKDQPLFFRRFVRLGPDRFKGPGFQVPPGWKAEEKGLVAPTTGSASNGALSVGVRGHLAEARLKIDRAAGSVELLDFHPSEQWVFAVPRGWKKVAPQSPVRGMDAPRDQTDVAQDLVFATDDKGGISLKATESGTQVFNGGGFGQPSFHVRGTGFTVKELVLYFVRVPVRKE